LIRASFRSVVISIAVEYRGVQHRIPASSAPVSAAVSNDLGGGRLAPNAESVGVATGEPKQLLAA
jgi:hypothetical protein